MAEQVKTQKEKIMDAALKDTTEPLKSFRDKIFDAGFAAGRSDGFGDGYHAGKTAAESTVAALAKQAAEAAPVALEDRAKLEWDESSDLRSEFSSLDAYTAFLKATEAGRVKIFSREK